MANDCAFEMKIVGEKEDCEQWLKRMESYDEPHHFWRIFESIVVDEGQAEDGYFMQIQGTCAWSLHSCCGKAALSHYTDLFAVNTRELWLKAEAWSEEPGAGFQEHYLYDHGDCLADDCADWVEYQYNEDYYDSFEEFCEVCGIHIRESQLDENNCWHAGGFPDFGEFHI